jgi:SAM-dependent methyltransferase
MRWGLAALSLTAVLFEVALTRISSVLLHTHLTSLVIAACMAAIGVGAGWARGRLALPASDGSLFLARTAAWTAGSAFIALVATVKSPAGFYLCLFAVPFFFFGAFAAATYALAGGARVTYAADLAGGAAGALAAVPLLRGLGDIDTALVAVVLMCGAAVFIARTLRAHAPFWLAVPLAVLVSNTVLPTRLLDVDPFADFGFRPHLVRQTQARGGRILATAHDALARTDLVATDEPWVLYLFTDRMHTARIARWDGRSSRFAEPELERLARLKGFAFRALRPERVLVLGAGGGFDVALALQAGVRSIDAVEINGSMVRFTRSVGAFGGNVYDRPEVRVHEAEARRFVRGADDVWDMVSCSLLQTDPATVRAQSGYQSWVFTAEAVKEYLSRLRAGGVLAIVQNTEALERKTVATVLSTLAREGLATAEALGRIAVLALPEGEANPFGRLVIVAEASMPLAWRERIASAAREDGIGLRHLPGHASEEPYATLAAGAMTPKEWIERSRELLAPATDDAPFFYDVHRALPFLFVISGGAAALLLAGAVARERRRANGAPLAGACAAAALGAGFMMLQSALIARGQFLMGHPAVAVALAVGGMLVAAGCGSVLGTVIARARPSVRLALGAAAVVLAVAAQVWSWPEIVTAGRTLSTSRIGAMVLALVTSVALPAGLCFPACLELWGRGSLGPAALYTANALAAVVGASAAALIAPSHGLSAVLGTAAACYALAGGLALVTTHASSRREMRAA